MLQLMFHSLLSLSTLFGRIGDPTAKGNVLTPEEILADMVWIEGSWAGDFEGQLFEALYTNPDGQAILSLSKEFSGEKPAFIEFEKFQVSDDGLVLIPYPNGEKSDPFPLLNYDQKGKFAVFENKEHDFPTRISYRLQSPDSLVIVVSGKIKGQLKELTAKLIRKDRNISENSKATFENIKGENNMNDEVKLTAAECHKKFAVDIFNGIWPLLEKPDRTDEENETMLQMAYASTYHWRLVGTAINQARGEWIISRVNTVLGRGDAAWHHATRSLAICQANGFGDFDLAYAFEARARAAALNGNKPAFDENYRLAEKAGDEIKEEDDRKLFKNDLSSGPWFGMK